MVTIREILGNEAKRFAVKRSAESGDFVDRAIIILGKNCPHCKELLESSVFKEFIRAAYDRLAFVFDDEGYLFGADYSNITDLLERRAGISTPTIALREDVDVLENNPNAMMRIAKMLGVPFIARRRRRSSESSSSRASRRRSSKTNEFVERKKLRKEVRRAMSGCEGEVCKEV